MKHIFVPVRQTQYDVFYGLRENLKNDRFSSHDLLDIHLSAESYATFDKVELTNRRFFRPLFYRKLFLELEIMLKEAVQQDQQDAANVVVYIADEGIWAVLLDYFCHKWGVHAYRINVQHGFLYPERPTQFDLFIRRLLNKISIAFTGYPSFGLGFGCSLFDAYLVYGQKEKEFIQSQSSAIAFACPMLIKKDFIEHYERFKKHLHLNVTSKLILFALPYEIAPINNSIKGTLNEIFQEITPLAKYLREVHNIKLLLRFHPGADHTRALAFLNSSELRQYVNIDDEEDVVPGIARSVAVMSYDSTVLFEAGLVGVVPIVIFGKSCQQGAFTFPHEIVDLNGDYRAMLDQALSKDTIDRYSGTFRENTPEIDWGECITQLTSTSDPK